MQEALILISGIKYTKYFAFRRYTGFAILGDGKENHDDRIVLF